ncbi:MAG TPA: hypothetical protein VKA89_05205 [Solirubrobacterales bacterium]|nr:hypothetical protein [Solirubrobacterales bacterium]
MSLTALALTAAFTALAVQVAATRLVASRVERRLTRRGGTARVAIRAIPALRLLAGRGRRITVRGEGLSLAVTGGEEAVFERLDGFGTVDVRLLDITVGPLAVGNLRLDRAGTGPYRLRAAATSRVGDLVRLGTERLSPGGSLIAGLLGGAVATAARPDREVPLEVDMELDAGAEGPRIVGGGTTVAGYPTGPVGQAIGEAVLAGL